MARSLKDHYLKVIPHRINSLWFNPCILGKILVLLWLKFPGSNFCMQCALTVCASWNVINYFPQVGLGTLPTFGSSAPMGREHNLDMLAREQWQIRNGPEWGGGGDGSGLVLEFWDQWFGYMHGIRKSFMSEMRYRTQSRRSGAVDGQVDGSPGIVIRRTGWSSGQKSTHKSSRPRWRFCVSQGQETFVNDVGNRGKARQGTAWHGKTRRC